MPATHTYTRWLIRWILVFCPVVAIASEPPQYSRDVQPILSEHCFQCHGPDAGQREADLRLDVEADAKRDLGSRFAIRPHDAERSALLQRVRSKDPSERMPPPDLPGSRALTSDEILLLERWIAEGAPWSRHWSFEPLQSRPPADVRPPATRNAIDAYVVSRQHANGLTLSPPASTRDLIRRLTYDLTGLPPTVTEVETFLQDTHPLAYERLVERLLAAPGYGERWGRHWLDLARYTDTTASWLKSVGQAWLYRDWVIGSMNDDLPYDQFASLQLAADAMSEQPEHLAALGFLGLSPTYWKELRLAPDVIKRIVADEWDERIDAVSRTFLGLTVSCARCHDHKFDPITMRDYYALAGVFASSQLADRPLLPDNEAARVEAAHQRIGELEERHKLALQQDAVLAARLQREIEDIRRTTPQINAPWVHVMEDASIFVRPDGDDRTRLDYAHGIARDLPVFQRGNPTQDGPLVERRFLTALTDEQPEQFRTGSGRSDLAHAIFTESQPLAARVIVNRIWQQHFGQGLVRTVSDFGAQGGRPSHPDLLDDLARRLIEQQWSLKWLHREIVLSDTYRQASQHREAAARIDPENRLLWRMHRRRLEVEMLRDAMLAVGGHLQNQIGGPAAPLEELANQQRTVYGKIARRDLNLMLRIYDFPEPTAHTPRREHTITPLQQLFLLNSEFVQEQATRLAAELQRATPDDDDRVTLAYERLFGRPPTTTEMELAREFLDRIPGERAVAWVDYSHSLLSLNEFLFVD